MLSGKQRRYLRSLAVSLKPVVRIGKEGLNANVIASCMTSLEAHELVKVSVLKNCEDPFKAIAFDLAATTNSEIVQMIGKVVVLYKQSKKKVISL
ncbi:MAG: ribosome assembly RNA-binding protein YhbY [Breznakia sp.]